MNLHSETVRIERRPADRAVAPGDDAFRERTIEAVATSEEAVVGKETRVTGEVVVKKDAHRPDQDGDRYSPLDQGRGRGRSGSGR